MKVKILTFSKDYYEDWILNRLTDAQLYEHALSDSEHTFIYDYANVREFTDHINKKWIDINNNWIYCINID